MKKLFRLMAAILSIAMLLTFAACKSKEGGGNDKDGDDDEDDGGEKTKITETVSYEDAERSFLKDGLGGYSKLYALSDGLKGEGAEMTLKFIPEDYIVDLSGAGKLNPTVIETVSAVNGGDIYSGGTWKNGTKAVLSADMWMSGDTYTMLIPALTSKYITGSLQNDFGFDMSTLTSSTTQLNVTPPSDAELQKVLDAVYDKYFELLKAAPVEKGVKVSVGDIEVTADKTEIEITDKVAMELALALLQSVKDSAEVKQFVTDIVKQADTTGEYSGSFNIDQVLDQLIDEVLTELEDYQPTATTSVVKMAAYVSGADIVKRDITVADGGSEIGYFSYTVVNSGKQYATEFAFESYQPVSGFSITNSGTKSGDSYTGELVGKIHAESYDYIVGGYADQPYEQSYEIKAVYKDLTDESGEIILSTDSLGAENKAEITLKYGRESFTGSLAIGGVKYATVELTYKEGAKGKAAPSVNSSNSVTMNGLNYEVDQSALGDLIGNLDDGGVYDFLGFVFNQYVTASTMTSSYSDYPLPDDYDYFSY